MSQHQPACPAHRDAIIDTYFLEHRAKLIDIAAFLDRIDRADPDSSSAEDFRTSAFRRALAVLIDGQGQRAKRVQEVFSDPSTEPIQAAGVQGAYGAYPGDTSDQ